MRLAFRSIALFNVATALWLTVMFVLLRHADYVRNGAMTLCIAGFCAFAVWTTRAGAPAWMRTASTAGSLILGAAGAWAIYEDLQPNAGFEGFVLIIGAMWIAQAVASLLTPLPAPVPSSVPGSRATYEQPRR